mmetsp:Transcript_100544/g.255852  ORF Transcript_100544/g.255852 Transcript_100544/m.255852 type:complete len:264 (-) Transcript_100544:371-1162(-)
MYIPSHRHANPPAHRPARSSANFGTRSLHAPHTLLRRRRSRGCRHRHRGGGSQLHADGRLPPPPLAAAATNTAWAAAVALGVAGHKSDAEDHAKSSQGLGWAWRLQPNTRVRCVPAGSNEGRLNGPCRQWLHGSVGQAVRGISRVRGAEREAQVADHRDAENPIGQREGGARGEPPEAFPAIGTEEERETRGGADDLREGEHQQCCTGVHEREASCCPHLPDLREHPQREREDSRHQAIQEEEQVAQGLGSSSSRAKAGLPSC